MRKFFKFISVFVALSFGVSLYAQLSNTLYFNDYNPRQHWLNPSFRPGGKFYDEVRDALYLRYDFKRRS